MTLNDAITTISNLKPHQYTDEQIAQWLSTLDASIYNEFLKWHHGTREVFYGPYYVDTDGESALMVPAPYDDLYIKYLQAQIDYWNGDMARYNNSMMMYNAALQEYVNAVNRENMPYQRNIIRGVK